MAWLTPKQYFIPKAWANMIKSAGLSKKAAAGWMIAGVTAVVLVGAAYVKKTSAPRDQYDAIAVWQNNSEGNWDIAYAIYRQSSDSWFAHPDRDIFYDGTANLIAKVPGDDEDPDIASVKSQAMAVWSNRGGEGNRGSDIYVARWTGVWDTPVRLFDLPGDDTDPTVSMEAPDRAMAVWVNNRAGVRSLYYSIYSAGLWTNPERIPVPGYMSRIAAPELGYITLPFSRYLLTFEAVVGGVAQTYMAQYDRSRGWLVEKISGGAAPRALEGAPAKSRTASSMHVPTRNAAVAWGGNDGNVWVGKASPADESMKTENAGEGENPAVIYEKEGVETVIYARGDVLLSKTPVSGNELQITSGEKSPVRPDAAALIEPRSRSSVVVWRSSQEGEGEIYFSSADTKTGGWTAPRRIDVKGFAGDDVNPAVSPILVRIPETGEVIVQDEYPYLEDFCGDGVVQKAAGEECEIGVPCKTGECDWDYYTRKAGPFWALMFAVCECLLPPDQVKPEPEQPKKKKKSKEEVWYGGAACGFDGMKIASKNDEEMTVVFTPPSLTGDTYRFANNGDGTWSVVSQTGTMKAFPYAATAADQPEIIAILTPKGDTITMRGLQPGIGLQLCIGDFVKGAPVHSDGNLMPAPADENLLQVPTL